MRVRSRIVILIASLAVLFPHASADAQRQWQNQGYVAHALGAPPGNRPYTNSFEAFRRSYDNGFRTFEVDLVRLGDGTIFMSHDNNEHNWGLPEGMRFSEATAKDLAGKRLRGRYPARFGRDLLHLIKNHPDCTFILDTKGDDVAIVTWLVRHAFTSSSRQRMVPHVHSTGQVKALRRVYDFPSMVIATYRWKGTPVAQQAPELADLGLDTVMIREGQYSEGLHLRLLAAGVRWIFIHDAIEPAKIREWRARGLGVYSHYWRFWLM